MSSLIACWFTGLIKDCRRTLDGGFHVLFSSADKSGADHSRREGNVVPATYEAALRRRSLQNRNLTGPPLTERLSMQSLSSLLQLSADVDDLTVMARSLVANDVKRFSTAAIVSRKHGLNVSKRDC